MQTSVKIAFEEELSPDTARAFVSQVGKLKGVGSAESGRAPAPEGARAADAIVWTVVLVDLLTAVAPDALSGLVSWLRSWLARPGAKPLKLIVPLPDGSTLEIDPGSDSPEELRAKVEAYRTAFKSE